MTVTLFRTTLAALVACGAVGPVAAQLKDAKDDVKAHLEKLAGTWKLEKEIRDGEERKKVEDIQLTFKGDKVTLSEDGKAMEATVKIDPSTKPAEMDITLKEGGKEETLQAIYELNGDTLQLAFNKEGGVRPAKFESAAGSKVTVATLKRVKK